MSSANNLLFLENLEENSELIYRQKYVPRQLIVKVVNENISIFDPQLAAAMTALVEIHAISVTGFNNDFKVKDSNSVSSDAIQFFLKPTFLFNEKYGKVVAAALLRFRALQQQQKIDFDIIAIEPDVTYTQIVDAWLCENMVLESFSSLEINRNVEFREEVTHSIECLAEFGCSPLHLNFHYELDGSNKVLQKAKEVLKGLNVVSSNPGAVNETMTFIKRILGTEEEK